MSHPLCSVAPTHFPVVMEDVCLDTSSVMALMIAMITVMNKIVVLQVSNHCDIQLVFVLCSSESLSYLFDFIEINPSFLRLHLWINLEIHLRD